jgi:hypothetical protein
MKGLRTALDFIKRIRDEGRLKKSIEQLGDSPCLDDLVRLGAEENLVFSRQDLLDAIKYEWGMRWKHYSK